MVRCINGDFSVRRLNTVNSIQYFQFDEEGNMFMFPPGSGCSGVPKMVRPGDELFDVKIESLEECNHVASQFVEPTPPPASQLSAVSEQCELKPMCRQYNLPLEQGEIEDLSHKKFSDETLKKIRWVTKMYREWRAYRNGLPNLEKITCDLEDISTISYDSLILAVSRFITEVKKLDGNDFPGKTLYDIVVCLQFHLECMGFGWKLLSDDTFMNIRFTLDNMMKLRTAQGIGVSVRKAQIMTATDEDLLWSMGLFGTNSPEVLLNTIVLILGKGMCIESWERTSCFEKSSVQLTICFPS